MIKKIILNISFCVIAIATQAQALLPTFWNFSTPSISAPPVGWTLGLGSNGSLTYAGSANSVGGDNTAARLDATNEYITIWLADKPGQLSYWLKGTGINPAPSFTGTFKVQESADTVNWIDMRTFTTSSPLTGTMTRFVNTPALTSRYIRFFYATKESGSNVSLDSVVIKAAPQATTPTLVVSRNNQIIANNTQNVVGNNANFSFKVKNIGTIDTLVINSISFTGKDANAYAMTSTLPIKVAANDSTVINCTLNTTGNGSKIASINIFNNDIDKTQFIVNLYGIAGSLATEPSFKSTNVSFTNVTAYGMNVSISDTSSTTENYVVLRKKNGTITEVPTDGITYQRGDYIGAAQVAYVGKVGTFRPAYILANNNYSFAVFSFNGPATFENYLTSSPNNVSVQSLAGNPGTYYSTIDPSSSSFLANLSAKVNIHDTIFYSNYITTVINNFLTRDTTLGKKVVNFVYTGIPYIYAEPFVWNASGTTGILTREHTRAQSTMPSNNATQNPNWPRSPNNLELPEYNDQHNLFPAHQTLANAPRSNNPFGECVTVTSTSPSGYGKLGKDANNNTIYEPKDEQKGDLARALFYMSVCYNGINGNIWTLPADQGLSVLMKWHQQDPPSEEEIARHEFIASVQKNRNPFIDNPSWANLIDFKTMTLITGKILTVNTPNGGENLVAGKTTNITWLASGITGNVKLEYTTNGTDFIFIDSVNASPASYAWTVPSVATTTAKIRITTADNATTDLSNANFTINIPTLKLLTPVSGDIWKENDSKTITWQNTFVDSISIKLKDGIAVLWAKKELASIGSISLTVPFANTANAKVFINEINGNLKDSSAAFSIQPIVGINEVPNANFNIYPNPSNGTFYFTTDLNLQHASFELFDVTGKLIIKDELNKTNSITIQNKGIYVLKATVDGQSIIRKIVVE
ncbi:MAG: endonuclease [Bacteroidia bacterium]|nr:endonuclease [Bacteroidia bacterium]